MSKALKYGIGKPITFSVPFLDNYINQYVKTINTNFYISPTFKGDVTLPNININGTISVIVNEESRSINSKQLLYLLNVNTDIQTQFNNISTNITNQKFIAYINTTLFGGNIIVSGNTTIGNVLGNPLGNVNVNANLVVNGNTTIAGNLLLTKNLIANGTTILSTELGFLSGVTSSIQTQLNSMGITGNATIGNVLGNPLGNVNVNANLIVNGNTTIIGNTIQFGQIDASNLAISGFTASARSLAVGDDLAVGNNIINSGYIVCGKTVQCDTLNTQNLIINGTTIQYNTQAQIDRINDILSRNNIF